MGWKYRILPLWSTSWHQAWNISAHMPLLESTQKHLMIACRCPLSWKSRNIERKEAHNIAFILPFCCLDANLIIFCTVIFLNGVVLVRHIYVDWVTPGRHWTNTVLAIYWPQSNIVAGKHIIVLKADGRHHSDGGSRLIFMDRLPSQDSHFWRL